MKLCRIVVVLLAIIGATAKTASATSITIGRFSYQFFPDDIGGSAFTVENFTLDDFLNVSVQLFDGPTEIADSPQPIPDVIGNIDSQSTALNSLIGLKFDSARLTFDYVTHNTTDPVTGTLSASSLILTGLDLVTDPDQPAESFILFDIPDSPNNTPVPEPATFLTMSVGAAYAASRRRRRAHV